MRICKYSHSHSHWLWRTHTLTRLVASCRVSTQLHSAVASHHNYVRKSKMEVHGFLACRWKVCSEKITAPWKTTRGITKTTTTNHYTSSNCHALECFVWRGSCGLEGWRLQVEVEVGVRSYLWLCVCACVCVCCEMMRQSIKWGCPEATAAALYCSINQNQDKHRIYTLHSCLQFGQQHDPLPFCLLSTPVCLFLRVTQMQICKLC